MVHLLERDGITSWDKKAEENSPIVLVFRTDIKLLQTQEITKVISELGGIHAVSFDLEDCDKILRVVSTHHQIHIIEKLLYSMGVFCEELED